MYQSCSYNYFKQRANVATLVTPVVRCIQRFIFLQIVNNFGLIFRLDYSTFTFNLLIKQIYKIKLIGIGVMIHTVF